MFKFIEFLKARPTDKQMRIGRVIFGLIILVLLGLFFNDYNINFTNSSNELYIKYSLFILGIVPLIMGATDICFAKRKYVKIIQIIFGLVLIIIGNNIEMKKIENTVKVNQNKAIDINNIETKSSKKVQINVGFWIAFLGILPLIMGITGKCISQKCYKYGEVIKKIRV